MKPTDREKFLTVLAGVHDFYGKELSTFAGQVWLEACDGFDVEQVTKALSAHLMDAERGQWMPKPADIVRQLQGTHTDRALVAWGKVLGAMQRVGAYSDVVFDDAVIHASIRDIGGWVAICRSSTDELPHLQRRFCDSYRAYARRPDVDYPPRLQGEHSAINAAAGFSVGLPVLIGNADRAREVMGGPVSVSPLQLARGAA
jgi:hypothetical protein